MLAPIDKLESGRNDIMQVVVTRSCDVFNCSNCTQLLPFRKDAMFMSVDVFREAVRSMTGWPGVVAVFGGNPCTHPRFADLCAIMREEIPEQRRRGLWTNDLMSHGAVIKDTFWPHGRFNLNVHTDSDAARKMSEWLPGIYIIGRQPSWHGGMLLDHRDLGISEHEWEMSRERCDINQNWSGAIYERDGGAYGYPCEVHGALDGVRGENNGVKVFPGWWRLRWHEMRRPDGQDPCATCVGCGVPLRTKGHKDVDDTYDVSRSWEATACQSHGKIKHVVHSETPPRTYELTDYASMRGRK